jgi:hypothetical protein
MHFPVVSVLPIFQCIKPKSSSLEHQNKVPRHFKGCVEFLSVFQNCNSFVPRLLAEPWLGNTALIVECLNEKELERIWKEVVMAQFEVLWKD